MRDNLPPVPWVILAGILCCMNFNSFILLGNKLLERAWNLLLHVSTVVALAYCFVAPMVFGLARASSCVISALCTHPCTWY